MTAEVDARTGYSDRVLHAAGHLLREWRRAAVEDNLTDEERLDTLAAFLRAILDHGGGTWTFPPLTAADLMAMPDAEFEQRQRDTGMESQVRAALVTLQDVPEHRPVLGKVPRADYQRIECACGWLWDDRDPLDDPEGVDFIRHLDAVRGMESQVRAALLEALT